MFGWSRTPVRLATLALFMLSILVVVGQSSTVEATSTVPAVGRTLRAVVQYNGIPNSVQTPLYGGAGMTITNFPRDVGNGFQIDFSAGTWISPKTLKPCYFVPVVSALQGVTDGTKILTYVENVDGSGTVTLNAPGDWSFIAESANC